MKKETIQAIAAALHALADEFLGSPSSPDASPEVLTGEPVTTAKRPRGRPAGTTVNMTPAEPSSTPAPAEKVEGNPTGQIHKDLEDKSLTGSPTELWEENKERIRPVITAGFGTKVKAIVANYSPTSMKDIPVDKIPAFRRDIEALTI